MIKISFDDYLKLEGVNSSQIKFILTHGLGAWHRKQFELEDTEPMKIGRMIHLAILEPELFKEKVRPLPDFGDLRSSTNREKKQLFLEQNPYTEFLSEKEIEKVNAMIEAVGRHATAIKILREGQAEMSFTWNENGQPCKGRVDFVREGMVTDFKSTKSCAKDSFEKDMFKMFYFVQMAFYRRGYKSHFGKEPEFCNFICVENQKPFNVAVYELDNGALDAGDELIDVTLKRIKKAQESNDWPELQTKAEDITLPQWGFTWCENYIEKFKGE